MRINGLPHWILKYKRKARNSRWLGVLLLIFGIDCFIFGPFRRIFEDLNVFENLIADWLFFASWVLFSVGLGLIIGARTKYRKVDKYYICHYVGWKNRLIVDGEEQDSSMMGKCYGTLPDGREVTSGGLFRIKFTIYDPQTNRKRIL